MLVRTNLSRFARDESIADILAVPKSHPPTDSIVFINGFCIFSSLNFSYLQGGSEDGHVTHGIGNHGYRVGGDTEGLGT